MIRSTSLSRLRETAYTLPKGSVRITLTCGHTAVYVRPVPRLGEDAYCRVCRAFSTRTDTGPRSPRGGRGPHR